jgi:hypothetical protein
MGLFTKKPSQKTAIILDIENGSVASAIAILRPGEAPQLLGEYRVSVPVMDTRSALHLSRAVEHAANEALLHASETAARMRNHAAMPLFVDKIVTFMAAPWGVPNLTTGRPDFSPFITQAIALRVPALFGDIPIAPHAHMSAAVHGLRSLYPSLEDALLVSVNGELSELLLIEGGHAVGHATVPAGVNTILRTLQTHGGLSSHEARSVLALQPTNHEGLQSAAHHYAGEFKSAARDLFAERKTNNVVVLAHGPSTDWFARALSDRSLSEVFPRGGTLRTLKSSHAAPYVATTGAPDLHLALDALYTAEAHS